MQQTARFSRAQIEREAGFGIRLQPVVHLLNGQTVGLFAQSKLAFEEAVRFGPAGLSQPTDGAIGHIARVIEAAGALARGESSNGRPIHIPVPMAALMTPGFVRACTDAAARAHLCPQELVLDIPDSALFHRRQDIFAIVKSARSMGLRIGIDARKTWDAPLSEGLQLLIDRVTVRRIYLEQCPSLESSVEAAVYAGMEVIVEDAYWRDGPWLAERGVTYALRPRTDG